MSEHDHPPDPGFDPEPGPHFDQVHEQGHDSDAGDDEHDSDQSSPGVEVEPAIAPAGEEDGSETRPKKKRKLRVPFPSAGAGGASKIKRETRFGLAALLSFVILVTVLLINKRGRAKGDPRDGLPGNSPGRHGKSDDSLAKSRSKDGGRGDGVVLAVANPKKTPAEPPPASEPAAEPGPESESKSDPNPKPEGDSLPGAALPGGAGTNVLAEKDSAPVADEKLRGVGGEVVPLPAVAATEGEPPLPSLNGANATSPVPPSASKEGGAELPSPAATTAAPAAAGSSKVTDAPPEPAPVATPEANSGPAESVNLPPQQVASGMPELPATAAPTPDAAPGSESTGPPPGTPPAEVKSDLSITGSGPLDPSAGLPALPGDSSLAPPAAAEAANPGVGAMPGLPDASAPAQPAATPGSESPALGANASPAGGQPPADTAAQTPEPPVDAAQTSPQTSAPPMDGAQTPPQAEPSLPGPTEQPLSSTTPEPTLSAEQAAMPGPGLPQELAPAPAQPSAPTPAPDQAPAPAPSPAPAPPPAEATSPAIGPAEVPVLDRVPSSDEAMPVGVSAVPPRFKPGEGVAIPNAGTGKSYEDGFSAKATGGSTAAVAVAGGAAAAAEESKQDSSIVSELHVVERGENFWTISRHYYSSGRYYKALWKANSRTVSAPDQLMVGQTIVIPPPEALDRSLFEPARVSRGASIPSRPSAPVRRTSNSLAADDEMAEASVTRSSEVELALPIKNSSVALRRRPRLDESLDPPPEERTRRSRPRYRVRAHETLRRIALNTLNDAQRADEILELNRDLLDGNPRNLVAGQILELPEDARVGGATR